MIRGKLIKDLKINKFSEFLQITLKFILITLQSNNGYAVRKIFLFLWQVCLLKKILRLNEKKMLKFFCLLKYCILYGCFKI